MKPIVQCSIDGFTLSLLPILHLLAHRVDDLKLTNTMMKNKLKIYIAGPDVFELNAKEIGCQYVAACEKKGFIGLYPLDNEIKQSEPIRMAKDIYLANKKMIESCDIVIANLNPFRGKEADSGTVWEVGYAVALEKQVYGYMADTNAYIDCFKDSEKKRLNGLVVDNDDLIIEEFGLPINLMIACSINLIKGDFNDVLKEIVVC